MTDINQHQPYTHQHDNTTQDGERGQVTETRRGVRKESQASVSRTAQKILKESGVLTEDQVATRGMDQGGSSRSEVLAEGQGGTGATDQEGSGRY